MSIVIELMIGELELIKTDNLFHPLSPSCWRIWVYVNSKQKYTRYKYIVSAFVRNRVKSNLYIYIYVLVQLWRLAMRLIYDFTQQINSQFTYIKRELITHTVALKNKQLLLVCGTSNEGVVIEFFCIQLLMFREHIRVIFQPR